ncbi:MAG TPA: trypsin-like peptidase domain-containing protein [Intrasporangium sp.]|uniref:S1C family serine protease n=1 Tax=Intrasporangium sp. TaxID=1925024 RepID=UPI002D76BBFF|nr:trypsin-like peptidase domain-containing protein [Intrasporangium sp.]HET7398667.1 trypsin-like peptidase domain-containing protein [Intrasporangium sp.]
MTDGALAMPASSSSRRGRGPAAVRATAVAAALALGVAGCTGTAPGSPSSSPSPSSSATTSASAGGPTATASGGSTGTGGSTGNTGDLSAVPRVAARVQPSVVTILVSGGLGSGVVYTADGLILTNEHVVRGNTDVQVAFADGRRAAGRVTATDPVTDLALVQADRKGLPPARFQTQLPQVGSLTVVIGSPLGFQSTVTAGIVSGLHRQIPGSAAEGQSLVDLLQTDAPISPGNSGGAVANAAGEVIGISEAYIPPQAGAVALGFAIPAATAVSIADQLRRDGRARHAFAGLVPAQITPEIAAQLGLSSTAGVIVAELVRGGPADRAGLAPGDVITAVDGRPTATPEDFLAVLRPHAPGDVVAVEVTSPGRGARTVKVALADRPGSSSP